MHEFSVTQELVKIILKNSKKPKEVVVELGALTTYKKDPIEFNFDLIREENKSIKDTKLTVIEIPGKIKCNSCGKVSQVEEEFMIFCPECSSRDVDVIEGKDFNIKEIIE